MLYHFRNSAQDLYVLLCEGALTNREMAVITQLLAAQPQSSHKLSCPHVGYHSQMVTPWSTNVQEILHNLNIVRVRRIEHFTPHHGASYDKILRRPYTSLDKNTFRTPTPVPVREVADVVAYVALEGLSLTKEEVSYLMHLAQKMQRPLTDTELCGYAQVHAEHCRHKVFNSRFVLDGVEQARSLFDMIRATTSHATWVVSAYVDNVAFLRGARIQHFCPEHGDKPSHYCTRASDVVYSLKAETHNFPTTVEPFYGAGTGTGGELRDRMAGGTGAIPLGGVAVYMTAYSRLSPHKPWERQWQARPWLYQSPADLLVGASNGASDYSNKFGQPLVGGSVLTFEHQEGDARIAYDKVVMLAGGVGISRAEYAHKRQLTAGQQVVVLGGDNYRIGMGGSTVSSASTGAHGVVAEQSAVQRANPEMQKRVVNVLRFLVESGGNPIVSIHDHGAGGHLNCFLEMLMPHGGTIHTDQLPVGDASLSEREKALNESQERMGLVLRREDIPLLRALCEREQVPCYVVGEVQAQGQLIFKNNHTGERPISVDVRALMGAPPLPTTVANTHVRSFRPVEAPTDIEQSIRQTLRVDSVACKDWLTNKVDRCVGGRVAKQPCCGPLQLPLNNVGVLALCHEGPKGVATALGHAPLAGLINPQAGAQLSLVEALTNILWAPLARGIEGLACSANWMWPNQRGDRAALYCAVEALTEYATALGVSIPTGKDSLFMDQHYPAPIGTISAPGTVVILASGIVSDIRRVVEPVLHPNEQSALFYLPLGENFTLGGSAFAQTLNRVGSEAPIPRRAEHVCDVFQAVQRLVQQDRILAGHDVSSGGLITTLLEMCFAAPEVGMRVDLTPLTASSLSALLFSESPGLVIQAHDDIGSHFAQGGVPCFFIGRPLASPSLVLSHGAQRYVLDIAHYRRIWFETSLHFDAQQCPTALAEEKYKRLGSDPLSYKFPNAYDGVTTRKMPVRHPVVGVLRDKGSNGEREMAYAFHRVGLRVKDIHMSDLIAGRETLQDVNMLAFVGGFSHADVLGAAKGWAASFLHRPALRNALNAFYARHNTLSFGVCNGCQLMLRLSLIDPTAHLAVIPNVSGKFECHFTDLVVEKNDTVMLGSLAGCRLGVWCAHAEGKIVIPTTTEAHVVARYASTHYPRNPNGSEGDVAALSSADGKHLAMMPHIERSLFPWNWAHYPRKHRHDSHSPWIRAFANARDWLLNNH